MFLRARSQIVVVALASLLFMAGCQTGNPGSASAPVADAPQKAILVTTANGVAVYVPTSDGKARMLANGNATPCAQCESDAAYERLQSIPDRAARELHGATGQGALPAFRLR